MTPPTAPDSTPPVRGALARLRAFIGAPGSGRRVILRNAAWEYGSYVAYAAAAFVLAPIILGSIGDSNYGIWELVIGITGFFGFADFGVSPAIVHFIARHDALGDKAAVNRYVNSAFLTFCGGGIVILSVAIPLAFWLPEGFRLAEVHHTEATLALLIIAARMAINLPFQAFSAILIGKQRYDRLRCITIGVLVVRAAAIILVLAQGGGLIALASVHLFAGVLQMALYAVSAFRTEPALVFSPRLADRAAVRGLLGYAGWAVIAMVALQLIWATDTIVIGAHWSPVHIAWFVWGAKLALQTRDFLRVGVRVIEPAAGALDARGDVAGIRRLLQGGIRLMLLLAAPVLIYLMVVGSAFLERWAPGEYSAAFRLHAGPILALMALAVLPSITSYPLVAVHYGTNRVRPLAILMIIEAGANLALSLALVGSYGIVGVAVGTMLPAWIIHFAILPILTCRRYGISWAQLVPRTWIGPVVAGALAYGGMRLIVAPDASYGWPVLVGLTVVSVAVFAAAVYVTRLVARPLWGEGPLLSRPSAEEPTA